MNQYFAFSRPQLWFVSSLCVTAVSIGGYLTLNRLIASHAPLQPLTVTAAPVTPLQPPAAAAATVGTFVIDPNTAPADSLELLPGIGPTKASAITTARDTLPFATAEDLLRVDGIGPKTLAKMRPFLKVTPP